MLNNSKILPITKQVKMKKLNCAICDKYKKFKNRKISYIFLKALVLSIDCSKCNNEDEKYLKKKNQLRY